MSNKVILGMFYASVASSIATSSLSCLHWILRGTSFTGASYVQQLAQKSQFFETFHFGPAAHGVGAAKALVNAGFTSGSRVAAHECTRDGANGMPDGTIILPCLSSLTLFLTVIGMTHAAHISTHLGHGTSEVIVTGPIPFIRELTNQCNLDSHS